MEGAEVSGVGVIQLKIALSHSPLAGLQSSYLHCKGVLAFN